MYDWPLKIDTSFSTYFDGNHLELIPNFQSLNYVKFFRIAICKIS